jgi:hypothetical protein
MSNVEGMYSARRELLCRTVYFIKKTEQAYSAEKATKAKSETILQNSAVRYSIFCSLLFPATRNPQPISRNPQRLQLFQIFSDDATDLISVSGQNIIDDFFGGAF